MRWNRGLVGEMFPQWRRETKIWELWITNYTNYRNYKLHTWTLWVSCRGVKTTEKEIL